MKVRSILPSILMRNVDRSAASTGDDDSLRCARLLLRKEIDLGANCTESRDLARRQEESARTSLHPQNLRRTNCDALGSEETEDSNAQFCRDEWECQSQQECESTCHDEGHRAS